MLSANSESILHIEGPSRGHGPILLFARVRTHRVSGWAPTYIYIYIYIYIYGCVAVEVRVCANPRAYACIITGSLDYTGTYRDGTCYACVYVYTG